MDTVKDMNINSQSSVSDILNEMKESGGYSAKPLGRSAEILGEMFNEEYTNFFSFPACLIAVGCRGVIKDIVKKNLFQCIITTCGTWEHDILRSHTDYFKGEFDMSDHDLLEKGLMREGNVVIQRKDYAVIEDFMMKMLNEIYEGDKEFSTYELSWEIGKRLKEDSVLHWAYKNKIPVVVPGFTDGAPGTHLFMFQQDHKDFKINTFKDELKLSDFVYDSEKLGALMLGGGISKHHVIWWAQFKDGLNRAVYMTSAAEWDGSLSGARLREAVSWGKVHPQAKYATIPGDVTINLPFLIAKFL